jgi:signal transduction histidine kinase
MARHQASCIQDSKNVSVVEVPPELNDDAPLDQLLRSLQARNYIGTLQNSELPLIWKVESDIPDRLLGDSMRLTQILLNLCSNAVKVSPPPFI